MSYYVQARPSSAGDSSAAQYTPLSDMATYTREYGSRFDSLRISALPSYRTTLVVMFWPGTYNVAAGTWRTLWKHESNCGAPEFL